MARMMKAIPIGRYELCTQIGQSPCIDAVVQLSKMRRIGVSQFRKTTLINIREFYEKDGKTLPGKKVIGTVLPSRFHY